MNAARLYWFKFYRHGDESLAIQYPNGRVEFSGNNRREPYVDYWLHLNTLGYTGRLDTPAEGNEFRFRYFTYIGEIVS